MPRMSARTVAALAVAAAGALAGSPSPAGAQDPPTRPATRLSMSLEKVLPLLNTAVVKIRTPGDAAPAAGSGAAKTGQDVKVTHLTGIRVSDDLAVVLIPD